MTIKLSICIPTYNRACFLEQSLESILNNQIKDYFEVIIVDNNSMDYTEKVVKKFKNDLNIVYKKNLQNIGAVRNLIKAVEFATGEYVWLWSDDDVMIEGAADYLHKFLINYPDVDYIYYPRVLTDKELKPIPNGVQPSGYKENIFFENGNALMTGLDSQMPGLVGFFSSTIIRRTYWNEAKKVLEGISVDEFHYLKILLKAILSSKCVVLEKRGVYCRLNYRGFSNNSKVWFDEYIKTFQFAKDIGYSDSMCKEMIKGLIKTFSKMFVVDKAKGNRNDNISSAAAKLYVSHLIVKRQPWYFLSFLPSRLLNHMMRCFFFLRTLYRNGYSG